jgi:N-acyl-D-amino-acid deacylase
MAGMEVAMIRRQLFVLALLVSIAVPVSAADHFPGREWTVLDSPRKMGWSVEKLAEARELSRTLDTAAVMIVQGGVVVDQWGTPALPLKCHSVRKSLLSLLFGSHVASGTIDLDKTLAELGIDDNQPSLTESEKQARISDLLKSRSGVYHPALYETAAMAARRPERGSNDRNTFWYYNNWDFNTTGAIFENLTARSIFEEFENKLAGPLQLQDFVRDRHTRYVTGDDSVHPAYAFVLSTRDLARIGLLALRQGSWQGKQLVPREWIAESTRSYSDAGNSGGYGLMWWVAVEGKLYPGISLPEGSFSARGFRGQYLVVVPEWDLVVCHRVNSFQDKTTVSKTDFGKMLALIVAARPRQAAPRDDDGAAAVPADPQLDILLEGGTVIDGTGMPRFVADVGVRQGRIVAVGDLAGTPASRVIDVRGRIVAPGFIDMHSHADRGLVHTDPLRRSAPNLTTQGITTVVVNQDGRGPDSIARQRETMEQRGIGLHVVQLVGHGSVRRAVMGNDYRRPATSAEIKAMAQRVRQGMEEGAFGMSAGLEYVPGRWSTEQEMRALVEQLAPYQGVYVVHERSSGSSPMWYLPSRDDPRQPSMIDNIQELINISESTGVNVVATHIKAKGVDFWGSSRIMIDMIEKARSANVNIYADQYAYNTSGTDGRIVLIPGWLKERLAEAGVEVEEMSPAELVEKGIDNEDIEKDMRLDIAHEIMRRGGAAQILVLEHPDKTYVGQSLAELAVAGTCDPVEMAIRLQLRGDRDRPGGVRLRGFSMSEKDVAALASQSWTCTSTDAAIALPGDGPVHPRFYGAFPRKLRRFALEQELISLEEAVRVSTSLTAGILGLPERGLVKVGFHADLVVFDPLRLRDRADAFEPHRYSEGIEQVLVGGELVVDREQHIGKLAGRVVVRSQVRDGATGDERNE